MFLTVLCAVAVTVDGVAYGKFKGVYCHDSGKGVYYPDTSYYGKVSVHGQEYLTALYYTPAEAAKGYDRLETLSCVRLSYIADR